MPNGLDFSRFVAPLGGGRTAGGFQQGLQIREFQEQRAARRAQEEAQQQQLLQQQQRAQALQSDLGDLALKVSQGQATDRDYLATVTRNPELSQHFQPLIESLSEEQMGVKRKQALNVFSALEAGQTDIAKQMLQDQLAAAENAGDAEEVAGAKANIALIDADPQAARTTAGLALAATMGPGEFANVFTKLQEEERAEKLAPIALKKAAKDLELSGVQFKEATKGLEKLGIETQKAALELEALKAGEEEIPVEKKFDMEDKLRAEFIKRSAGFEESRVTFDRLDASAEEALTAEADEIKGPADVALVTAFMKMLDPGSVVRETEFANARDTAGLVAVLANQLQKLRTGGFLTDEQRRSFKGLAGKYMEAAERQESRVRKSLEFPIKNYGLDRENIFGERAAVEAAEEAPAGFEGFRVISVE